MFYQYGMSIARRYSGQLEQAEEVLNDAFFKAFTKIETYSSDQPFKFWLRRIIINTAIDRYRVSLHRVTVQEINEYQDAGFDDGTIEMLTREQIISMLDLLPPAYRTVFNLFVVDEYSHEEISQSLGISIGASKSNLSRARQFLRRLLKNEPALLGKI